MNFTKPEFFVGSLPFQSVDEAILFVKKNSNSLPFLPQLPELNPQEDMIGQVLRGFELGYWDEKASVALEAFQNEFCESKKFKIQIAGPYTVSRLLSLSEKEVWPQWENLVRGLKDQFRQGSFLGEMWIQIDEPFWSEESRPHEGYLEKVKKLGSELGKTRFGLHSCATKRPSLSLLEMEAFHFLSFDCEKTEVSLSEKENWKQWLKKDPTKILAWGAKDESRAGVDAWALEERQVWFSASCGLAYSGSFLASRIF